jgi:hypothetical protein
MLVISYIINSEKSSNHNFIFFKIVGQGSLSNDNTLDWKMITLAIVANGLLLKWELDFHRSIQSSNYLNRQNTCALIFSVFLTTIRL